ncbi:AAA family ATPase [Streptosporangium lutulentum]
MTMTEPAAVPAAPPNRQTSPAEERYAAELAFLAAHDDGPRPPGWALTPRAVVTFVCGSGGETLELPGARKAKGGDPGDSGVPPTRLVVSSKFVGERSLIERCVVTLAGERGLLLVGEPGTAKSMLSELLAAAVCGTSSLTVQGTARPPRTPSATAGTTPCCSPRDRAGRRWSTPRC